MSGDAAQRSRAARLVEWGLLALALVVLVAHSAGFGAWIVDDAAITFAYAENLARHGELTTFPGGERVEGFSNPSWLVAVAALDRVGLLHPVWTPKLLGLLLQIASLLLVWRLARRALPRSVRPLAGFAPLLLALNTPFVAWGISGLENPLYAAAILAGVVLAAAGRTGWSLGAVLALIALTRPEGPAVAAAIAAVALVWPAGPTARRTLLTRAAPLVAAVLVAALILRWFTFHDVLPNTAHAKLGDHLSLADRFRWQGEGFRYLREGLAAQRFDLLVLLAVPALVGPARRVAWLVLGAATTAAAFAVYAGGDWMMEFRFLTPVYPLLVVLGLLGIATVVGWLPAAPRAAGAGAATVLAGLVAVAVVLGWPRLQTARQDPTVPMDRVAATAEHARKLADELALPHVRLVFADIGGSSLWGSRHGVETIDIGRLASRVVARLGYGHATSRFLLEAWRPDVLMLHRPWNEAARLHEHPDFHRLYRPVWENPLPDDPVIATGLYVRRDLVEMVADQPFVQVAGPAVAGATLLGWRAVRGEADGTLAVDLVWRADAPDQLPELTWRLGASGGAVPLRARALEPRFVAPGTLLRAPLPVVAAAPGDTLEVVSGTGSVIAMPAADLLRVAEPVAALTADALAAVCQRALAAGDTLTALRAIEGVPPGRRPLAGAPLREVQSALSTWLVSDASAILATIDASADVARAVHRATRAMRLWPGNIEAMLVLGDLLPLQLVLAGDAADLDRLARTAAGDDGGAILRLSDLPVRLLDAPYPLDRWRLRGLRERVAGFTVACPTSESVRYLDGWLGAEHWGRWAVAGRASVLIPADAGQTVVLQVSAWEAMSEPQHCRVLWEGEPIHGFTVAGAAWQPWTTTFTLPAARQCGVLCLEFARTYPDPPPGTRRRAIALHDLKVR